MADRHPVHVGADRLLRVARPGTALCRCDRPRRDGRRDLPGRLLPRLRLDGSALRVARVARRGDGRIRGLDHRAHARQPAGRALFRSRARRPGGRDLPRTRTCAGRGRACRLSVVGHTCTHGCRDRVRPGPHICCPASRPSTCRVDRAVSAVRVGACRFRPQDAGTRLRGWCRPRPAPRPVRLRIVLPRARSAAARRHRARLSRRDHRRSCRANRFALRGKRAGPGMSVEIRELTTREDFVVLGSLLADVWGPPAEPPMGPDLLIAMAHSGTYIAGAFAGDEMIGGLIGWLGLRSHELLMHSHILGVLPGDQARGVGFELKQHQRRWCLARGVKVMEWTTDPLVRRNAYFNLTKLGADAPAYLIDFYGEMQDGINAGDQSDRLLIRWRLDSQKAE